MATGSPDRFAAVADKSRRKDRIFIDYLRNARGATAICPYSTRARHGAPVAAPVTWKELASLGRPDAFDIETVRSRLDRDPWDGYFDVKQSLTERIMRRVAG